MAFLPHCLVLLPPFMAQYLGTEQPFTRDESPLQHSPTTFTQLPPSNPVRLKFVLAVPEVRNSETAIVIIQPQKRPVSTSEERTCEVR